MAKKKAGGRASPTNTPTKADDQVHLIAVWPNSCSWGVLSLSISVHMLQGDAAAQVASLRDQGSKFFATKEYAKALECYDKALKAAPAGHPETPLLHSNKAACHMMGKK